MVKVSRLLTSSEFKIILSLRKCPASEMARAVAIHENLARRYAQDTASPKARPRHHT